MLKGPQRTLTLFEASDRGDALQIAKEIGEFLGLMEEHDDLELPSQPVPDERSGKAKLRTSFIVRAVLVFFYVWCAAILAMGLFSLLLGLGAALDWEPLGNVAANGRGFIYVGLILIPAAVGAFFVGRYAIYRFIFRPLEVIQPGPDDADLQRQDSGAGQTALMSASTSDGPDEEQRKADQTPSHKMSLRSWLAISAILFLMGVGMSFVGGVMPMAKAFSARAWPEVPCVIFTSEVGRLGRVADRRYRIDISYKYEIDGQEFQSSRYSFWTGSSSGRRDKQAVADRYPPGTRAVCYVNPEDPTKAVIDRGLSIEMWMFLLIPGLFGVLGAAGLVKVYRYWRAGKSHF